MIYWRRMPDKDFNDINLPEGFSGSELRLSTWWIENRGRVRSFAIGAFVVFDIILLLIALWGIFDWLVVGGAREERAIRRMTSPSYLQFAALPTVREVKFGAPLVLSLPDARYDVLIPVENENVGHWLELGYRIVIGGEETPLRKTFVLPGQSKFIAELAIPRKGSPGSVALKVETRKWRRVDPHVVKNYADYAESHQRFSVSDPTFTPAPKGDTTGGVSRFSLSNDTAFTYLDPDILVLLYRGGALVGVNKITLDRLEAGERRDVELFWFQPLPQITRTDVLVDVNILDADAIEIPR